MIGDGFIEALLATKPGTTIVDKRSMSAKPGKPSKITLWLSDGTEVAFSRADVAALKTEEQLSAFVQKLLT